MCRQWTNLYLQSNRFEPGGWPVNSQIYRRSHLYEHRCDHIPVKNELRHYVVCGRSVIEKHRRLILV